MAEIRLTAINKVYPNGTHAVHDVDLHIADGEFMIMVGPSGCAKSTILRMIAGLETPTSGTVEIGGRVVNDVAPKDRDIAMVFQSYALYPHMTVRENMAFGLKLRKMPPGEIDQRVADAARILGLEQLLDRLPKQMSGGQRQRVAMGRAIVREPQAFLMDEPLSNLDAKLRVQMRTEIAKLHQRLRTTTVYVTHDQVEAMTLGQRICILRRGVVQQVDTPYMVYTNPANVFVGGFIGSPGMNFLTGSLHVHDGHVWLQLGQAMMPLPPSVIARLLVHGEIHGMPVIVGIRPEHLHEAAGAAASTAALTAQVELTEAMGSESFAYFSLDVPQPDLSELSDTQAVSDTFVAKLGASNHARAGEPLLLAPDLTHVHLFDPHTQASLLAAIDEHLTMPAMEPETFLAPAAMATARPAAFDARPVTQGFVAIGQQPVPATVAVTDTIPEQPVSWPIKAPVAADPVQAPAAPVTAMVERTIPRPSFRSTIAPASGAAAPTSPFAGTVRAASDGGSPGEASEFARSRPAALPAGDTALAAASTDGDSFGTPHSVAAQGPAHGALELPSLTGGLRRPDSTTKPNLFQGKPLFARSEGGANLPVSDA